MGARRRDDDAMIMNTMMMNTVSLYRISIQYIIHESYEDEIKL